jgi:hypothetical protein
MASFWGEVGGGARCRPRGSKVFKQVASLSDWLVHRVVALMIMMASGWYLGARRKERNGKQKVDHRDQEPGTV